MVDVSLKQNTLRTATATGRILIPQRAYEFLTSQSNVVNDLQHQSRKKGDVLTVAQLAAIMGGKRTSELIPLCHPLNLTNIAVNLTIETPENSAHDSMTYAIQCNATAICEGKTGVEMEALTAVSIGLLTVWDMLKAVAGREMKISDIYVSSKSGGKSGSFTRTA